MKRFHILDTGSIWLREFASALSARVPVTCWQPEMRYLGSAGFLERVDTHTDPPLAVRPFPLQRGYWRFPVSRIAPFAPALLRRMSRADASLADSVLIVTTPYYAPVAERWPGTVVYYLTDFTAAYDGADEAVVRALDRRLSQVAAAVFPNSTRLADYLTRETGCDPAKITVVPQATRAANLYAAPPYCAGPLPADIADLPRPLAGVIGNLASNMDWVFLEGAILQTPEFYWLLVGPTSMPVELPQQRASRERLLAAARLPGARLRFTGARPYGELQRYARAVDVAVLPYHKHEPTFSGSSTRFYEHLAACRPMIATEGFHELLSKEPLLRITPDSASAVRALNELRACHFDDGLTFDRWQASLSGTWENRAGLVADAVAALQTRSREPELASVGGAR